MASSGIVIVSDVEIWRESTSQLTTRQYRGEYRPVDRSLNLNSHFDKMLWPKPPPGTREVFVVRTTGAAAALPLVWLADVLDSLDVCLVDDASMLTAAPFNCLRHGIRRDGRSVPRNLVRCGVAHPATLVVTRTFSTRS